MEKEVKITYSRGRGKGGQMFAFIRPMAECFNRSRRIGGNTTSELEQKISIAIQKYFAPKIKLFSIDGRTIASNSEKFALKEYWRVCEKEKIKKSFEVKLITHE